jgi:hypothetical protein
MLESGTVPNVISQDEMLVRCHIIIYYFPILKRFFLFNGLEKRLCHEWTGWIVNTSCYNRLLLALPKKYPR